MAKKKEVKKKKINVWKVVLWAFGISTLFVVLMFKSFNDGLVKLANPFSSEPKEFVFTSCGSRLPDYKYSLRLPDNWTVYKPSYDLASTYYEARYKDAKFTISCTNQGVGGDVCSEKYLRKFKVGDGEYEACFGLVNGKWDMGVLNLDRDEKTQALISFWSVGLEETKIDRLLSTFSILNK